MPVDLRNPVLEGYLSGLAIRRQREQDEIKNELQAQENMRQEQEAALKEKQFQKYVKHLDVETKHQNAMLDLRKQETEMQRQKHIMDAQRQVRQDINSGVQRAPTQGEASSSPVGGQEIVPGSGIISDPRQFITPQETAQRKLQEKVAEGQAMTPVIAGQHGANVAAEEGAKAPYTQMAASQKLTSESLLQSQKDAAAEARAKNERTFEAFQRAADRGNRITIASMQRAGMSELAPAVVAEASDRYAGNFTGRPLGTSKLEKPVRLALKGIDKDAVDIPAGTAQQVRGLAMMDPIFAKLDRLVEKLPPDAVGANWNAIMAGPVGKVLKTELATIKKEMDGVSDAMGREFLGMKGVITEKDTGRISGLFDITDAKQGQAREIVNFTKGYFSNRALNSLLGNVGPKQKLHVLLKQGRDPSNFIVEYKGRVKPAYVQDPSDGEWGYFDTKTGKYKAVDEE